MGYMDGIPRSSFNGVSQRLLSGCLLSDCPLSLFARWRHLHLHVISADLCSPAMKVKKHYNSFHPKLGFFIPLDDVLSWFDAEDTFFSSVRLFIFAYPQDSMRPRRDVIAFTLLCALPLLSRQRRGAVGIAGCTSC